MRVGDHLEIHARQNPNVEFAVCGSRRITYAEAKRQVDRIAKALIASGLRPGDRLGILQQNSIEMVLLFHGAFKVGMIPTPINYRLLPSDWLRICQDAQPILLICDGQYAPEIDRLRNELESVRILITTSKDAPSAWIEFETWLNTRDSDALEETIDVSDEDALLMYTSGTTGKPKGAVLTHYSIVSSLQQLKDVIAFGSGDRFLMVLPLCHAAGIVAMLQVVSWGATLVIHTRFDAAAVVRALQADRIAVTMMVPTMLQKCIAEGADSSDTRFEALKLIVYGAAPIQESTVRRAMEVFGCDLAQRYGTTETFSLTWLGPTDHKRALEQQPHLLKSAGRALPGTEVDIVDSNGETVPIGEMGEIAARGPQLMRGYWNPESADVEECSSDWMRTGDVGYLDSDGYVYICDRAKDVIVSGGENIYPHEIEEVLVTNQNVKEAAVIGIPDASWGETVHAIVMLADGATCTADQLIDYCHDRLAGFKVPHSVQFVAELPRNPGGKILKRELREPYWQGQNRRV